MVTSWCDIFRLSLPLYLKAISYVCWCISLLPYCIRINSGTACDNDIMIVIWTGFPLVNLNQKLCFVLFYPHVCNDIASLQALAWFFNLCIPTVLYNDEEKRRNHWTVSFWWNRWHTHICSIAVWFILLSVLHHSSLIVKKKKTQSHCV